jgi:NAD(P)-dependent dehydrogenase (short-subunit alcohol dehydrogenase family)
MEPRQFDGKVALVTGGSSGIGEATAVAFAEAGARTVVADVQADAGRKTVERITSAGGDANFFEADVSRPRDVEAMVQHALEIYGRLDCAFNNAGIEGDMASTVDCTERNWDRVIEINLKGVWLCMKHEVPAMLQHGGGAIVNCASVAGLVGFRNLPAYCASKGGVVELTRATALEYADAGIRVDAVCPGVIRTPMVERVIENDPASEAGFTALEPVGRMGEPEEIAASVLWLCSDGASFVTGHALVADGGLVAQ